MTGLVSLGFGRADQAVGVGRSTRTRHQSLAEPPDAIASRTLVRTHPLTNAVRGRLPRVDLDLLRCYACDSFLAVKGEDLQGAGGCVVSGLSCAVDGVEGVADYRDALTVPGRGQGRQGRPG